MVVVNIHEAEPIMWLRLLAGISLLLVSHPPLVLAQPFRVGPVYTDQPGEVSVVVELPPGARAEASDFQLLADDGVVATAQEIKTFQHSGRGLALAFCVDVSGTMSRGPLDEMQEALLSFIGKARPEDHIALVSFADEDETVSSFEDTREHLSEAVRSLRTRGNETRLYQTVYKSLELFQGAKLPKRRRVIVISDGKDEGSIESPESINRKSDALGIPIDTVGRGRIEEQYLEALRGLSNATGGYFVHARPDRLSLQDALDRLYEYLSATRSLVVYFRYEVDDTAPPFQNAWIELRRPGEPASRVRLAEAIPRGKAESPDRDGVDEVTTSKDTVKDRIKVPGWLWVLLVALLGIGLVVWGRRRTKSRDEGATEPPEPPPAEPDIAPPPTAVPPEPPRMTQVGGYYFPVPEPGRPTAVLRGVHGPVEGQQVSIEQEVFRIGASPDNDLAIAADEYVSGEHALLRYENGNLLLFDRGSRNGTLVNEHEVTETGVALSVGDHIRIGESTLEVVMAPR
jgi:Mg-chelatase subunit ChlD